MSRKSRQDRDRNLGPADRLDPANDMDDTSEDNIEDSIEVVDVAIVTSPVDTSLSASSDVSTDNMIDAAPDRPLSDTFAQPGSFAGSAGFAESAGSTAPASFADTASDAGFASPASDASFGSPASETTFAAPVSEATFAEATLPAAEPARGLAYQTGKAGASVVQGITQNLWPIGLAALGFWLYRSTRSSSPALERAYNGAGEEGGSSRMAAVGDALRATKQKVSGAVHATEEVWDRVEDRAEEVWDRVEDKAEGMLGKVGQSTKAVLGGAADKVVNAGSTLVETTRSHPVPATSAAISLMWLYRSVQRQKEGQQTTSTVGEVVGKAGQIATQARDKAKDLGPQAQQKATGLFQRMLQDNPLTLGAMTLVAGTAVGLALPETRKENELLGPTRDRVTGMAQETAQGIAQKVQTVAHEALDTVKEEARNQGLTGES